MVQQSAVPLTDLANELGISTARQLNDKQSLPVSGVLSDLFPGGLQRGSTLSVSSVSLVFSLLAGPTQAGSWAAIVGFPDAGVAAAEELGVELKRCAFIPFFTAATTAKVVAALIDSVDVVVLRNTNSISSADVRRLTARARERRCVLVLNQCTWPGITPLTLKTGVPIWQCTANGRGRLKGRWMRVSASGRGSMSKSKEAEVWLGDGPPIPKTIDFQEQLRKRAMQ